MIRQMRAAAGMLLVLTVLVGLAYPLAVTGVAQLVFNHRADGSFVSHNGKIVGSSLIGQNFSDTKYFHPRPSVAGDGYDATASSASNLGPTNADLLATIKSRTDTYRTENGLANSVAVPSDAVTASASGLDPQISVANARLQAGRVATQRGISVDRVDALIDANTQSRSLGFLGDPGINVLRLNLALDAAN